MWYGLVVDGFRYQLLFQALGSVDDLFLFAYVMLIFDVHLYLFCDGFWQRFEDIHKGCSCHVYGRGILCVDRSGDHMTRWINRPSRVKILRFAQDDIILPERVLYTGRPIPWGFPTDLIHPLC